MTVREQLIEILRKPIFPHELADPTEAVADYLLDNGVTVQQWIPVTERLPKPGQEIIVYDGGVQKPKVFAYQFWNKEYGSWAKITHWMPLPQAPGKEGG